MLNNYALPILAVLAVAGFLLVSTQRGDAPPAPAVTQSMDTSGAKNSVERSSNDGHATPASKADRMVRVAVESAHEEPTEASAEEAESSRVLAERRKILDQLHDPYLAASDRSKLWQRLAKLGMADEVIAELKQEVAESPKDTNLHTLLGNAYITKMRSGKLSPAERREATKSAMQSFDTAIELDETNWTARFSRAMSNSSAPAFLGLQQSAIKDFETLLAQQKSAPISNDHAHTYFFLSNLHEGSGNPDRANEVRSEARQLFPNDERFKN